MMRREWYLGTWFDNVNRRVDYLKLTVILLSIKNCDIKNRAAQAARFILLNEDQGIYPSLNVFKKATIS